MGVCHGCMTAPERSPDAPGKPLPVMVEANRGERGDDFGDEMAKPQMDFDLEEAILNDRDNNWSASPKQSPNDAGPRDMVDLLACAGVVCTPFDESYTPDPADDTHHWHDAFPGPVQVDLNKAPLSRTFTDHRLTWEMIARKYSLSPFQTEELYIRYALVAAQCNSNLVPVDELYDLFAPRGSVEDDNQAVQENSKPSPGSGGGQAARSMNVTPSQAVVADAVDERGAPVAASTAPALQAGSSDRSLPACDNNSNNDPVEEQEVDASAAELNLAALETEVKKPREFVKHLLRLKGLERHHVLAFDEFVDVICAFCLLDRSTMPEFVFCAYDRSQRGYLTPAAFDSLLELTVSLPNLPEDITAAVICFKEEILRDETALFGSHLSLNADRKQSPSFDKDTKKGGAPTAPGPAAPSTESTKGSLGGAAGVALASRGGKPLQKVVPPRAATDIQPRTSRRHAVLSFGDFLELSRHYDHLVYPGYRIQRHVRMWSLTVKQWEALSSGHTISRRRHLKRTVSMNAAHDSRVPFIPRAGSLSIGSSNTDDQAGDVLDYHNAKFAHSPAMPQMHRDSPLPPTHPLPFSHSDTEYKQRQSPIAIRRQFAARRPAAISTDAGPKLFIETPGSAPVRSSSKSKLLTRRYSRRLLQLQQLQLSAGQDESPVRRVPLPSLSSFSPSLSRHGRYGRRAYVPHHSGMVLGHHASMPHMHQAHAYPYPSSSHLGGYASATTGSDTDRAPLPLERVRFPPSRQPSAPQLPRYDTHDDFDEAQHAHALQQVQHTRAQSILLSAEDHDHDEFSEEQLTPRQSLTLSHDDAFDVCSRNHTPNSHSHESCISLSQHTGHDDDFSLSLSFGGSDNDEPTEAASTDVDERHHSRRRRHRKRRPNTDSLSSARSLELSRVDDESEEETEARASSRPRSNSSASELSPMSMTDSPGSSPRSSEDEEPEHGGHDHLHNAVDSHHDDWVGAPAVAKAERSGAQDEVVEEQPRSKRTPQRRLPALQTGVSGQPAALPLRMPMVSRAHSSPPGLRLDKPVLPYSAGSSAQTSDELRSVTDVTPPTARQRPIAVYSQTPPVKRSASNVEPPRNTVRHLVLDSDRDSVDELMSNCSSTVKVPARPSSGGQADRWLRKQRSASQPSVVAGPSAGYTSPLRAAVAASASKHVSSLAQIRTQSLMRRKYPGSLNLGPDIRQHQQWVSSNSYGNATVPRSGSESNIQLRGHSAHSQRSLNSASVQSAGDTPGISPSPAQTPNDAVSPHSSHGRALPPRTPITDQQRRVLGRQGRARLHVSPRSGTESSPGISPSHGLRVPSSQYQPHPLSPQPSSPSGAEDASPMVPARKRWHARVLLGRMRVPLHGGQPIRAMQVPHTTRVAERKSLPRLSSRALQALQHPRFAGRKGFQLRDARNRVAMARQQSRHTLPNSFKVSSDTLNDVGCVALAEEPEEVNANDLDAEIDASLQRFVPFYPTVPGDSRSHHHADEELHADSSKSDAAVVNTDVVEQPGSRAEEVVDQPVPAGTASSTVEDAKSSARRSTSILSAARAQAALAYDSHMQNLSVVPPPSTTSNSTASSVVGDTGQPGFTPSPEKTPPDMSSILFSSGIGLPPQARLPRGRGRANPYAPVLRSASHHRSSSEQWTSPPRPGRKRLHPSHSHSHSTDLSSIADELGKGHGPPSPSPPPSPDAPQDARPPSPSPPPSPDAGSMARSRRSSSSSTHSSRAGQRIRGSPSPHRLRPSVGRVASAPTESKRWATQPKARLRWPPNAGAASPNSSAVSSGSSDQASAPVSASVHPRPTPPKQLVRNASSSAIDQRKLLIPTGRGRGRGHKQLGTHSRSTDNLAPS